MAITYARYADGGSLQVYIHDDQSGVEYVSPDDTRVTSWVADGNSILPFEIEEESEE